MDPLFVGDLSMIGLHAQESTGPQPGQSLALRLSTSRHPAPAGTGVLSWLSWIHQTVAVTTCVKPTMAAAPTLTSSVCEQRGVMSAVRIAVGRLETNITPATALMTVYPEETAAPTTRNSVKEILHGCRMTVRRSGQLNVLLGLCVHHSSCCQWMDSEPLM